MTVDTEAPLFTLRAMLKQECMSYRIPDYFKELPTESSHGSPVDTSARRQIAEWCMNILDACSYPREVAAITMSCLDRFVASSDGHSILLNRSEYQLAALAALYSCCKIHCPQALSPDLVAKLSHGTFTREDIETMERRMLSAIQWRVNPPTSMDFVRQYLDLISFKSLNSDAREAVVQLTGYQADLSVSDFYITLYKPSHVGAASVLNAIESIFLNEIEFSDDVAELLSVAANIDINDLKILRGFLYEAIAEQTDAGPISSQMSSGHASINKRMHRDSFAESPRSVYEHSQSLVQ